MKQELEKVYVWASEWNDLFNLHFKFKNGERGSMSFETGNRPSVVAARLRLLADSIEGIDD